MHETDFEKGMRLGMIDSAILVFDSLEHWLQGVFEEFPEVKRSYDSFSVALAEMRAKYVERI